MKKTIFLIVGLIMLIVGVVMAQVGSFQLADISGFAVTMFGAGLAAATLWSKKETGSKTWLCLLGVVAIGIGAFMLGFAGFAETAYFHQLGIKYKQAMRGRTRHGRERGKI